MKKIITILMAGVMTFSIVGCQPTPKEDIVKQKEEGVKEVNSLGGEDVLSGDELAIGNYEAPENWQEEIQFDNSSMKINIDATIEYPKVSTMPSYIVNEKAGLPQETIDALIAEFFGSEPIYNRNKPKTKSEIQQEILDTQLAIQEIRNGNSNSIADPEFMEEMVKEMQEELKTAPVLSIYHEELNASKSISREEAIHEARALLDRLGIQDMVLDQVVFAKVTTGGGDGEASDTYGYNAYFVHEIDGIPSHGNVVNTASLTSEDVYHGGTSYESLSIGVTKEGIFDFSWNGHFEVGEKEVENVALLPFEEIQEVFAQSMHFAHGYLDDPDIMQYMKEPEKERTFYIHRVKLGYAKAAVKNEPGVYRLVPVWNFYTYHVDKNGVKDYDTWACMSINAMDGSIFR